MSNVEDIVSNVTEIAEKCRRNEAAYRAMRMTSNNDGDYCYELFRYAIVMRVEFAWEYIVQQYSGQVTGWVWQHPRFHEISIEANEVTNRVFGNVWSSLSSETFQMLHSMPAMMKYLKQCVSSVIFDEIRSIARRPTIDHEYELDQISTSEFANPAYIYEFRTEQKQLWRMVYEMLNTTAEQTLIKEIFVFGRKTDEIVKRHPSLFPDANAVYRAKANLLKRLRRKMKKK